MEIDRLKKAVRYKRAFRYPLNYARCSLMVKYLVANQGKRFKSDTSLCGIFVPWYLIYTKKSIILCQGNKKNIITYTKLQI
jgi:hypothetical protein